MNAITWHQYISLYGVVISTFESSHECFLLSSTSLLPMSSWHLLCIESGNNLHCVCKVLPLSALSITHLILSLSYLKSFCSCPLPTWVPGTLEHAEYELKGKAQIFLSLFIFWDWSLQVELWAKLPDFKSQFCCLEAMWPWKNNVSSPAE